MIKMDLTMVEFNKQLKKNMLDVKLLEKTHPSQAVNLWVKICKDIVNFAKSKNCPYNLRPKLIRQADSIIIKVKHMQEGHVNSVFSQSKKIYIFFEIESNPYVFDPVIRRSFLETLCTML